MPPDRVELWFDLDLLDRVLKSNELPCKPAGLFDDPEVGFVCVGDPHRIKTAMS